MEAFNKKVEMIKICLAVAMCIFGCLMLTAGFIVAPLGEIHQSVLIGFGEILTFSGAILGINYLYSAKHKELESHIKDRLTGNE
jgi:hypothetical protein